MAHERLAWLIILSFIVTTSHAEVFTVQAGAISTDTQWLYSAVYPLSGLDPPFAVTVGDSIVFACEGAEKVIVFTDRPYVPLMNVNAILDPSFTASGPSPVSVSMSNASYSSGLLYPGENFTFTFPVAGLWPAFNPVAGLALGTIVVQSSSAPYTPDQVSLYASDQIARDIAVSAGALAAAVDTSALDVGQILLSWSNGTSSSRISLLRALSALYSSAHQSTSITPPEFASLVVYRKIPVTFTNRDIRPWNIFINSTGLFQPNNTFGGGSLFLLPSNGTTVHRKVESYASSGVLQPGASWKVELMIVGTYYWTSTLTGESGTIKVVNSPASAMSAGRVFAALATVFGILVLIAVIGAGCVVCCDYVCMARRKMHRGMLSASASVGSIMEKGIGSLGKSGVGIGSLSTKKKPVAKEERLHTFAAAGGEGEVEDQKEPIE